VRAVGSPDRRNNPAAARTLFAASCKTVELSTRREYVSENLMDSIAPQLAPPVSREPIGSAAESNEGADLMIPHFIGFFADDDAE
jgi:hypothetical protein